MASLVASFGQFPGTENVPQAIFGHFHDSFSRVFVLIKFTLNSATMSARNGTILLDIMYAKPHPDAEDLAHEQITVAPITLLFYQFCVEERLAFCVGERLAWGLACMI